MEYQQTAFLLSQMGHFLDILVTQFLIDIRTNAHLKKGKMSS